MRRWMDSKEMDGMMIDWIPILLTKERDRERVGDPHRLNEVS